jgi:EmrB/QacA subfamily drug resistance transporter
MSNLTDTQAAAQPDPRRWKALALLCAAFFMAILDSSIVLVALPSIDADLAFSAGDLQWVMSAYLLSFGGLLLLGGRMADLLGRRRMFMAGTGLFALASLGAGLAGSAGMLVAARALQGVAAAVMTPTAMSILMTTFPEGAERNKALGIWTALGGIAGTAGWLVGGPITSALGWEAIFYINVPVGLALAMLSPALLRESRDPARARGFDLAGAITSTAALVLLVYAVVEAPVVGWVSGRTLGLLAAAAALIAAFAAIERRSAAPLVPLQVFRSRTLVGGNLVMLTLGMGAFGLPYVLTEYGQGVLGYSPVQFGLAFVVMPLMVAPASSVAQNIVTKAGLRGVATAGLLLTGLAGALLTRVSVDGGYLAEIFPGLLVLGLGVGAAYVAGSVASLAGVRESEAGLASGLNTAAFQIGAAVGVAIASSVAVAGAHGEGSAAALTHGYRSAFAVAIPCAVVGAVAAVALLGKPRKAESLREAQPVAV